MFPKTTTKIFSYRQPRNILQRNDFVKLLLSETESRHPIDFRIMSE